MRVLYEADVERLLSMAEAVEALERAFKAQDAGQATNRPRDRARSSSGLTLQLLGASLMVENVIGFKAYTAGRQGARFFVALYDAGTGALLSLIEADRMGQLRTGAASGVATRYMAREDATTAGIFGSGYQAETQLEAVCAVRPITRALVYGREAAKREAYAARMSERLGIEVAATGDPKQCAQADIVITATTAREPVVRAEWLKPGAHVNAIGANALARRELDDEVVHRAAVVAVDSREQALKEATDLVSPLERGFITWERIRELHEIVSGVRAGRTSPQDITVFKSLGIGLEDVAVAALVYHKALEQGVGQDFPFLEK